MSRKRKARSSNGRSGKKGKGISWLVGGVIITCVVGLTVGTFLLESQPVEDKGISAPSLASITPDWQAISNWPPQEATEGGDPDPDRLTTVIVLDDSGSMKTMIGQAKAAVVDAVAQLPDTGRLAVIALNKGLVMEPLPVADARQVLAGALDPVQADGTTPLGASLRRALQLLEAEAAGQRGFGSYRVLIATDGKASDGAVLKDVIAKILSSSPVEIATIGIGIGEGHALNIPGFTQYVSVESVENLASALKAAAAEQTSFQPVTAFDEVQ